MEKDLICQRAGHNMPLDMICINQDCKQHGIFCHKCFMETHHDHMSSDVMSFHKFISQTQKTLDESYEHISSKNEAPLDAAREEYGAGRKTLENCKRKVQAILTHFFEEIENNLNTSFKSLEKEFEVPKTQVSSDLDQFKDVIRTLQTGDNNIDQEELNSKVLGFFQIFQPSDNNSKFVLKADSVGKGNKGGAKEDRLKSFKEDNKRIQSCLERVDDWLNRKPVFENLDLNQSLSQTGNTSIIRGKMTVGKITIAKLNPVPTSNLGKRPDILSEAENLKKYGAEPRKKVKLNANDFLKEFGKPTVKPTPLRTSGSGKETAPKPKEELGDPVFQAITIVKPTTTKKHTHTLLSRFTLDTQHFEKVMELETFALTFSTDRELNLVGFAQYLIARSAVSALLEYEVVAGDSFDEMSGSKPLLCGSIKVMKAEKDPKIVQVMFNQSVKIQKNRFYTIKVTNRGPELQLYRGTNGTDKKIPFSFYTTKSNDAKKGKGNNVKKGQIPELYYTN